MDWLRIRANAGEILTFTLSNLGPDADALLEILNSDLVVLEDNDNGSSRDATVIWPVPGTATYYVRLSNVPPTTFGGDAYYEVAITSDTGDADFWADAGGPRRVPVNTPVTFDGTRCYDPIDPVVLTYLWTLELKPAGSSAEQSMVGETTEAFVFVPDLPGYYEVLLSVTDGVVGPKYDTALVEAVASIPADTKWVDFGYQGMFENGTWEKPYRKVMDAVGAVPEGGTVKFNGNSSKTETDETPTIAKAVRLVADGGPVRIGVATAKSLWAADAPDASSRYTADAPDAPSEVHPGAGNLLSTLWEALWAWAAPVDHAEETGAAGPRPIYEKVLPFTSIDDKRFAAKTDSVPAVRWRSSEDLDPGRIWAPVRQDPAAHSQHHRTMLRNQSRERLFIAALIKSSDELPIIQLVIHCAFTHEEPVDFSWFASRSHPRRGTPGNCPGRHSLVFAVRGVDRRGG